MEPTALVIPVVLQSFFGWNLARSKCIGALIVALIKVRTVNLVQLAIALPGGAVKASKYRRLQRLFEQFEIDFSMVARFIVGQLPYDKLTVTMDRTNWKFGAVHINILFLGVVHQGIAVPILWTVLDKKGGNSNTAERIELMNRLIAIFGAEKIDVYVADREFIGQKWIRYLIDKQIKFRIRIKDNSQLSRTRNGTAAARNFFRNLALGEASQLQGSRFIWGHKLYITGARLRSGDYLIIISADSDLCEHILADYKKRWEIETLFKALKSQGFDFEQTHLSDPQRISKLVALLAIAFLWAHLTGEWLNEQKPIPIKSHGRRAISVFRYGLDYLRELLLNMTEKLALLFDAMALLTKRVNRIITN